jgi:CubicO group peptidase (beta-lactamase class C family)
MNYLLQKCEKKFAQLLLICIFSLFHLGATAAQDVGDAAKHRLTDTKLVSTVKNHLEKMAAADVFSGTVLIAKNGEPILRQAFGLASKEFGVANKIDTKFNLGSMNKMFTGVAIAKLVEQGKLSFDDPLSKFLPEFIDAESAKKIKIKHLLSHTAGLGSYFGSAFFDAARERFRTVDDMMTLLKDEKLLFEPGSRWRYSNSGMLVLGKVIEIASGESYFDYITKHIYQPAGMINSDSYQLDHVIPNLALGYNKKHTSDGVIYTNNLFRHVIRGGPAGGGYSTVDDLLNFAVALRGNKLVGAQLVAQLLSVKPTLNSTRYGFGFAVDSKNQIVGHSGGFEGISANLDMFLDNEFTVIVMSNYSRIAQTVADKIRELVLRGR